MVGIQHIVSLDSIIHNFKQIQKSTSATVGAVVKSNAYGHGAVTVSRALEEAGCTILFAGAIEEAMAIRKAGCKAQIIPLLGFSTKTDIEACMHYSLTPLLHCKEQFSLLQGFTGSIAIKCDTGMSRLGFTMETLEEMLPLFVQHKLHIEYILSHLATPQDITHTTVQKEYFMDIVEYARKYYPNIATSLESSSAIGKYQVPHADIVRAGIALYGYDEHIQGLMPALEIHTNVLQVRTITKGTVVSYGGRYTAEETMPIAIIACGYADGYHRIATNGYAIIEGNKAPIIGTICMQSIIVDVRMVPQCERTTKAYILAPQYGLCANTIAQTWNTIPYEVLCSLGKKYAS